MKAFTPISPEQQELYDFHKRLATTDPRYLTWDDREIIKSYREVYYGQSGLPSFELDEIKKLQEDLLRAQNINFPRYAYTLEFLPDDPVIALRNRIQDEVDFWFRIAEQVFHYAPRSSTLQMEMVRGRFNEVEENAWYWLKVLTILVLRRYAFPLIREDPTAFFSKTDAITALPLCSIYWAELPNKLRDLILQSQEPKEVRITVVPEEEPGLELEVPEPSKAEIQDILDRFVFEVTAPLNIGTYMEMLARQQEESNRKRARFRTFFFIALGAMIALPSIMAAITAASAAVSSVSLQSLSLLAKIKLGLEVFVGSLELTFKAFLTAIHFDTLIGVHKVAMLVSEEYRGVMRKVYGEITKVSSALGYGPYFLTLLLQNTRNLVMDVSTTLGMRYDLAEVQWLSTFQGYMKNFAGASYKYANNPEAIFFDLSRWVERDALDKKGMFIEGLIKTVERTTEAIVESVEQITVIRDDLNTLVRDLPDEIRGHVEPFILPYIERFDTFIIDTYDPYKRQLDGIIDNIKTLQDSQKEGLRSLVSRLKRPGDYLLEIDKLEEWEKAEQEKKIDDSTGRYYRKQLTERIEALEPISAELGKITSLLTRPLELLSWGTKEIEEPVKKPIGEIDKARTWYIGDY